MSSRPLFPERVSGISLGYLEPKVLPNREEFPSDCVLKAHRHSHKLPFPPEIDFRAFFELKRVFLPRRRFAPANPGVKKAFLCFAYAGDSRHLKSSIIRLICLIDILHTWRRYQTSSESTISFGGWIGFQCLRRFKAARLECWWVYLRFQSKGTWWSVRLCSALEIIASLSLWDISWIIHARTKTVNGKLSASHSKLTGSRFTSPIHLHQRREAASWLKEDSRLEGGSSCQPFEHDRKITQGESPLIACKQE